MFEFVLKSCFSCDGRIAMLAAERHSAILGELQERPAVRVADLAERLRVSEMTIRRDIDALDGAGVLRKVHGGAVRSQLSAVEPGYAVNTDREADAKERIAGAAARLLEPGMTIAVTAGTTTVRLARHLAAAAPLTVLTNSVPLADAVRRLQSDGQALSDGASGVTVLLTGGERTPSEALVGPLANAAVRSFNTDLCFMGVHGVDLRAGMTTPNLAEADTNRTFAAQCSRLAVLADRTKFGIAAPSRIAAVEDAAWVITDRPPEPGFAARTRILTPDTTSQESSQ
jgi:DeoR/GlpR family transcriptional regulator of sugar metabolism